MSFLGGLFSVLLVLMMLGVGLMALAGRRSPDGIPTFRDYKVLSVISGSMEPEIHTGDVIVIKPVAEAAQIAEGDIITFRSGEEQQILITHRVVGIISVNQEPAAFVTKGDANDSEDPSTVAFKQVVGRYQFRLPYFGYVASFIRKPIGIFSVVIIPGLVLIGLEFRKIWQALSEAEASKAKAKALADSEERE